MSPTQPGPLVEVRAVHRRFGAREALAAASFDVTPGTIFGIAGANGSGKTTLLKVLAGFIAPSGGEARVFGLDPRRHRADVMREARFAFAPPALYETLTAREHVALLAGLGARSNGTGRSRAAAVEAALEEVGLADRADDRVREFSFGMRQRLVLAQALVPTPRLLVLDEPTDGLDPLAVLELRGVLRRLRDERGVTTLLSSHLLVELDELVDHLLVLDEGHTIFCGAPAELLDGEARLVLATDDAARATALLAERGLAAHAAGDGAIAMSAGSLSLSEAAEVLRAGGLELREYHLERPTLERTLLARMQRERDARTNGGKARA